MTTLRLKVELNPGGEGVRMDKLAKITGEAEKFLRYLLADLGVSVSGGELVSKQFYNSSVGYTAELPRNIDDAVVGNFNNALEFFTDFRTGKSTINGAYKPRTVKQFVEWGKCLDADERMRLGRYQPGASEADEPEWSDLTRRPALEIEQLIAQPLVYHGSVQGRLGTWYKESGYFDVREVSKSRIVKCHYDDGIYGRIHSLYEDLDTVVHVAGMITASRLDGAPSDVQVERFKVYDRLTDRDFNRVFGLAPNLTGDETTEEFIDRMRDDDDA